MELTWEDRLAAADAAERYPQGSLGWMFGPHAESELDDLTDERILAAVAEGYG